MLASPCPHPGFFEASGRISYKDPLSAVSMDSYSGPPTARRDLVVRAFHSLKLEFENLNSDKALCRYFLSERYEHRRTLGFSESLSKADNLEIAKGSKSPQFSFGKGDGARRMGCTLVGSIASGAREDQEEFHESEIASRDRDWNS